MCGILCKWKYSLYNMKQKVDKQLHFHKYYLDVNKNLFGQVQSFNCLELIRITKNY